MEETVLICEDSIEGILTGVYKAYELKKTIISSICRHQVSKIIVCFRHIRRLKQTKKKAEKYCGPFTKDSDRKHIHNCARQWYLVIRKKQMRYIIRLW
ncbi:hypothetical protein C823_007251 [Eubacterium plexicaudatum ASF492]|nr:hypothetical protein C823_007251 [Eubacterium plexicaudatum ASF492]